jgi:PAS domain S-box-containing protein
MPTNSILVVEDESAFAQVVQIYLKRLGYDVTGVVSSGGEATRSVARQRPDLVLMDIEIQGTMDGVELAEQIRKEHDIPVIFLTGRSDEATLDRVHRSDSFGYLLKPFRPEELKAGIELALILHGREKHLKQIEQSFSAAIKSIGDAVIMTDTAGVVTFLNPAAERLTGMPARKAIGQKLAGVFQLQDDAGGVEQLFRGGSKGAFTHEAGLLTAAGREVPIEVSVSTIYDDARGMTGAVLVFRDITERKLFEAQLKKSQNELRSLAGHLEAAREAERTRIAREIHDEFGQMLTGLKIDISWLEKKLSQPDAAPRPPLLDKVKSIQELIHEMVGSVRRISSELRPGVLDALGLGAAVEWQVNEFQQRTGIKSHVSAALGDAEPSRTVATVLFRVLQESLTNVARHAGASGVEVELKEQEGWVTLEVRDNGRGISEEELNKTGAFGLMGMRERVIPLRGKCEIRGTPGQGTTVCISVPVDHADNPKRSHE